MRRIPVPFVSAFLVAAAVCVGASGCGHKSAASDGGNQPPETGLPDGGGQLAEGGPSDGGGQRAEAGPSDGAALSAPDGAVPCDDGTGALDCCPPDAGVGACAQEGLRCWSRCAFATPAAQQGTRNQLTCNGGQWSAGHGVFPCGKNGGT